jgi:hypothetical protein
MRLWGVFVTREHVRHNKSGIAHQGRTGINHLRELPAKLNQILQECDACRGTAHGVGDWFVSSSLWLDVCQGQLGLSFPAKVEPACLISAVVTHYDLVTTQFQT